MEGFPRSNVPADSLAEAAPVKAAPTPAIWRPYQIYVLVVMVLVTTFNYLDRGILGVLQEPIKHEMGLSDWQLGLLSGPFFSLFFSVAGIPVARLAERSNRAALLSFAVGFWSAMTALCGVTVGFFQLALCRIGVGAGEGGCIPTSHALLSEYFSPKQRGMVMSFVSTAPSLAGIITPLIGGYVAHAYGWRAAFMIVGLPGLLVSLLVWFTLKDPRSAAVPGDKPVANTSFWADARWLFANRAFLYLFLAGSLIGMGVSGLGAFRISFLVRSLGMSLPQAGALWASAGAFGIVGSFLGGYLADRFADDRGRSYALVPALGSALCFVFYVIGFTQSNLVIVGPAFMVATLAYSMKNGPMYAAVQNVVPARMRATGAAVFMFAATVIGGACGPMLAGGISDFAASQDFANGALTFAQACPGGRAPSGAVADLAAACASASANGLRSAMVVVSFVFAAATWLMVVCARHMRVSGD
ncbi:MAG: MFS transporter [Caulobacteraceae bacterium]